jgi:hypothetical protein
VGKKAQKAAIMIKEKKEGMKETKYEINLLREKMEKTDALKSYNRK